MLIISRFAEYGVERGDYLRVVASVARFRDYAQAIDTLKAFELDTLHAYSVSVIFRRGVWCLRYVKYVRTNKHANKHAENNSVNSSVPPCFW